MDSLTLIGIGTGNPDHLTFEGARAIQEATTILIPRKGDEKSDLADLRRQIVDKVVVGNGPKIIEFDLPVRKSNGDYLGNVDLGMMQLQMLGNWPLVTPNVRLC